MNGTDRTEWSCVVLKVHGVIRCWVLWAFFSRLASCLIKNAELVFCSCGSNCELITCVCFSEIQRIWACSAGGGDRWAAAGKEAGKEHGGDVSQESPGNEGTESSSIIVKSKNYTTFSPVTKTVLLQICDSWCLFPDCWRLTSEGVSTEICPSVHVAFIFMGV